MTATLSLPIDRNSPVPLYHQLALLLEGAVHSGALAPGRDSVAVMKGLLFWPGLGPSTRCRKLVRQRCWRSH